MERIDYAFITQSLVENKPMYKEMLQPVMKQYYNHLDSIRNAEELKEMDRQLNRTSAFVLAGYFSATKGMATDDVVEFLEAINFKEYLR